MKNERNFFKIIILFITASLLLSACAEGGVAESPEQVILKAKEAAKEIKAVDMSVSAVMKGTDEEDDIDFTVNADVKVDRNAANENKADADVKLSGALNAGGQSLSGDFNLKIRTLGQEFYFNLVEAETTDPKFQSFKPLLESYEKKWLHLASDFVPESIKNLQQKDEATLEKERQLKELFVNTQLFDVNKEYGIETLSGKKVYHYGVRLNKEGVKKYLKEAAIINGGEMTDEEVEEAALLAESVNNMEIWIGAKDYYLYKGLVALSGEDLEQNIASSIDLTYTANSYNADLKIEAPADAEEFNPIALMMGAQLPLMMEEGVMTEEKVMTEEE